MPTSTLLQRLSSQDSYHSNPNNSRHKTLDLARGIDRANSFPNPAPLLTKSGSGPGSDSTATASHDVSEEETDSGSMLRAIGSSEHKEEEEDKGGQLLVRVPSIEVTLQSNGNNGISPAAAPQGGGAVVQIETPTQSFEDDGTSSDTQDEAPSASLLEGLSAAVPQTPEEATAIAPTATDEEEKTEEEADSPQRGAAHSPPASPKTTHRGDCNPPTTTTSPPAPSVQPKGKSLAQSSWGSWDAPSNSTPGTTPHSSDPPTPPPPTQSHTQPNNPLPLAERNHKPRPPSLLQRRAALLEEQSQQQESSKSTSSGRSWDPMSAEAEDVVREMPKTPTRSRNGSSFHGSSPRTLRRALSLNNNKRHVEFSHVHIRQYNVCIGDNPCCSYGPPLSLDWEYEDVPVDIPMDVFEHQHRDVPTRRSRRSLVLTYTERRARLWRAGYSLEEIDQVAEDLEREKWRQSLLGNLEPLYRLQELWVLYGKPMLFHRARKRRELDKKLEYIERKVREEHSQCSEDFLTNSERLDVEVDDVHPNMDADLEKQQNKESQAVLIEGIADQIEHEKHLDASGHNTSTKSNNSQSNDNSNNNNREQYGIRVDKKQHDKATEIILCSLRRPHMRAFHAAWFSFFVAFFSWFAIAPLLSEVKESLGLEKADIWMSSLFGTAGTIVFRILTGPACDALGARVVMSIILACAAIPTALTGLVQTSAGLSFVRLSIGLAGASFVACQYWTSAMFSRETAGTANALVAGWGNFGGGVTNLMMGSVLFPLFRWFYSSEDDDGDDTTAAEKAWRTVFVIPAVLSIVTALLIFFFCDDSPTGSYRDRIKNESLLVAHPLQSIRKAAKNWNVWILTFQYACCFGVEVTMTNATALYFKDEFGQSTVSAAGIASIFGFMNLFARGLGGFCSDKLQNSHGVKGRLFWQMFTLILEGVAVGIFAFARSMAGSILALVFLSCMVQSAEGSTFGIVPYVDRRYTGSVVGLVGSGGNAGAAVFSIFFVYFSYNTGFVMMGLCAVGSAFLSLLMKTEKLAQTHEGVTLEVEQRNQQEEEETKRQSEDATQRQEATTASAPEAQDLEIEFKDEHGELRRVVSNAV